MDGEVLVRVVWDGKPRERSDEGIVVLDCRLATAAAASPLRVWQTAPVAAGFVAEVEASPTFAALRTLRAHVA